PPLLLGRIRRPPVQSRPRLPPRVGTPPPTRGARRPPHSPLSKAARGSGRRGGPRAERSDGDLLPSRTHPADPSPAPRSLRPPLSHGSAVGVDGKGGGSGDLFPSRIDPIVSRSRGSAASDDAGGEDLPYIDDGDGWTWADPASGGAAFGPGHAGRRDDTVQDAARCVAGDAPGTRLPQGELAIEESALDVGLRPAKFYNSVIQILSQSNFQVRGARKIYLTDSRRRDYIIRRGEAVENHPSTLAGRDKRYLAKAFTTEAEAFNIPEGLRQRTAAWRLPSAPVALGAAAAQEDGGSRRCRRP
uniref:Uncharacterized protein n=1 Tax=Oryza meridionalis TaxID=40149 RepID=A0A0E0C4K5_9ORYZ